jgi:hypothetical protein
MGILVLLLTGKQSLLLTAEYHRQYIANRPCERTSFATWFCLIGIITIFVVAWFISQLPPEMLMRLA